MDLRFETFRGDAILEEHLVRAAEFFSANYGVWGRLAAENLESFAKYGRRVRMSAKRLREQCLPSNVDNIYVQAFRGEELVGNVLAARWVHEGRNICWINQLVVSRTARRQGIATQLLQSLADERAEDYVFGILSSHPAAIMAALRAFGRGLEHVNMDLARELARAIMASSPVDYVRGANLHGSIFEDHVEDGAVSTGDTKFFVDHQEPLDTLGSIRACGRVWPVGELPEGHEFLVLVDGMMGINHKLSEASSRETEPGRSENM